MDKDKSRQQCARSGIDCEMLQINKHVNVRVRGSISVSAHCFRPIVFPLHKHFICQCSKKAYHNLPYSSRCLVIDYYDARVHNINIICIHLLLTRTCYNCLQSAEPVLSSTNQLWIAGDYREYYFYL